MKKVFAVITILTMMVVFSGCNKQIIDLQYSYKYAIINRYDGEQIIKISSWRDYSDGDQIQITAEDGTVYLLHSSKVILVSDISD